MLNFPNQQLANQPVIGRFAPSPTGALHLGSLITAIASYCLAKREQGQWLLRIEDTDTERCHSQFSDAILYDLDRLGLHWDAEVRYQSNHLQVYHQLLDSQLGHLSYGCDCSRKSIQAYQLAHPHSQTHQHTTYPRICVHKTLSRNHAIRLLMPDVQVMFFDQLQGVIAGNPQREHGDIVVRRRPVCHSTPNDLATNKGMINYMLAVVTDDALQGVNQIVRGLDILPLTIPQLVIADYLQFPAVKQYYHLPILVNTHGQKLSKQTLAEPIQPYPAPRLIQLALQLLRQPTVDLDKPTTMLQQAISQWDNTPLQGKQRIEVDELTTLISPKGSEEKA